MEGGVVEGGKVWLKLEVEVVAEGRGGGGICVPYY